MRPTILINAGILLGLAAPALSLVFASELIDATFDELKTHKLAFEKQELKIYRQLKWDGFSVDTPREKASDEFYGVEVKTKPNFAGGRVDPFGGLPTMTTKYPNSQVAFFDLRSFWWGCSTKDEKTGEPGPGWCTLEVRGYRKGSTKPAAKATSYFFPKEGVKSMQMVNAPMPSSFRAVSRVEFAVFATKPTLFIDNVKYTVYNVTSMGTGLGEVIHTQHKSDGEMQHGTGPAEEIILGYAGDPDRQIEEQ